MGWSGVDWIGIGLDEVGGWIAWDYDWLGLGDVGWGDGVKSGLRSGLRRLCVVCATTGTCCKRNKFIQIHAPG